MLKNFFWFAHRPADERETKLLYVAYTRAFTVLWIGLILELGIHRLFLNTFYTDHFAYLKIILSIFVLCIVAGWSAVYDQDFEPTPKQPSHTTSFAAFCLAFGAAFAGAALMAYLTPSLTYIAIIGFLLVTYLMRVGLTWAWMKPYTTHARLLASLIFALPTIGYLVAPKLPTTVRVLLSVLTSIVFTLLPIAIASSTLFLTVVTPTGITDWVLSGYDYHQGQTRVLINYRDVDVKVDDIIKYDVSAYKPVSETFPFLNEYGTVTQVDAETVTIDVIDAVSSVADWSVSPDVSTTTRVHHLETIKKSDILATVILDAPGSKFLRAIGL